jgi:ribose transport system substrate-binding protein
MSKILATQNWDHIDGLWMQVGCYTANAMQLEAACGQRGCPALPLVKR